MTNSQFRDSSETAKLVERVAAGDRSVNELLDGHREYLRRLIEVRMERPLR